MFGANGDDSFGLSTAAWVGTLSRNTARKNFFAEDFIFALSTIYSTYGGSAGTKDRG
jgi:hypothetical protein